MKKIIILILIVFLCLVTGCQKETTKTKANITTAKLSTSLKTTTTTNAKKKECSITSPVDEINLIKDKDGYKTSNYIPSVTVDSINIDNPKLKYSIDDSNIATIDDNGLVTAISSGTTKVNAIYTLDEIEYKISTNVNVFETITAEELNTLSEEYTNLYGRVYNTGDAVTLDNPATAIEVYFYGTELKVTLKGSSASLYFRAFIDDDTEGNFTNIGSTKNVELTIAEGLEEGLHKARIVKSNSPDNGKILIYSFETDGEFLKAKEKSELKIEFIGDSITVGFGNLGQSSIAQSTANSDTSKSYAYQVAQSLDADYSIIALEGICVTNSTLNMVTLYEDYSTSNKTQFDPASFDADIVVLALGENDMWHATDSQFDYSQNEFIADYTDFLKTIHKYHPNAYIICMFGMMPAFSTTEAKAAVQKAIEDSGIENIKFIQVSKNTSGSGEHPNLKAHTSYAKKLVNYIETLELNK